MAVQLTAREYDIYDVASDNVQASIKDALYQLTHNYSNGTYLCDAIMEVADHNVPVYNGAVLDEAVYLEEYAARAVEEGLYTIKRETFSIVDLFRVAYYMVIEEAVYGNIQDVIYNIMVETVNTYCDEHGIDEIDTDSLEDELSSIAKMLGTDDTYSRIEASALEAIESHLPEESE